MKAARFTVVLATVVMATGAAALAADKAATTVPRPGPEMVKLRVFEGRWSCSGEINATPFGPAHKTVTRVVMRRDLGGFWLTGRVTEAKTAASPTPLDGTFHQSWDPAGKQYLMLWFDNTGGWAKETSPGWSGDTIVWAGEGWSAGQKAGMRDSFTLVGPTELTHAMEYNVDGKWAPLGRETCRLDEAKPAPKARTR